MSYGMLSRNHSEKIQFILLSGLLFAIPAFAAVKKGLYLFSSLLLIFSFYWLARNARKIHIEKVDYLVIGLFLLYPAAYLISMYLHDLWILRIYDYPSRFILAAVIYLVLRQCDFSFSWFQYGLVLGALLFGYVALEEKMSMGWQHRVDGNSFSISFGNTSLLLGMLAVLAWRSFTVRWLRILLIVTALLAGLFGSLASGTRGGWIALPILFYLVSLSFPMRGRVKVVSGLILLLGLMAVYHQSNFVKNRVDTAIEETQIYFSQGETVGSAGNRLELWRAGILLWQESPLIGHGVIGIQEKLMEMMQDDRIQLSYAFGHLHNEFIHLLAAQGLLGLLSYIVFYAGFMVLFRKSFRQARYERSGDRALMGIVLLAAYIDFSLTQNMLAHSYTTTVLVIFLAIIAAASLNIKNGIVLQDPAVDA